MRLLLSPPIGIGLELRERLNANWLTAPTAAAGLTDRDFRGVPGVLGGVTPLPLARLAPITLTNSCKRLDIVILNLKLSFKMQ